MAAQPRVSIPRVIAAAALLAAGSLLRPAAAEAQARGTLQVSAQVVDSKVGSDGLQAARVALRQAATGTAAVQIAPATLAQIRLAPSRELPGSLVVTVDYSKD